MTFAVIQTGGKQYRVSAGNLLTIEKIKGDHKEGDTITFDEVLLIDDGKETKVGDPYIKGAKVTGVLEDIGRHKKIEVTRFRSKSRHFRRYGHRQPFFKVKIATVS